MRLTKRVVAASMCRRSDGVYDKTIINVGDHVGFVFQLDDLDDDPDITGRAVKNAYRWRWIDRYNRLTRLGYDSI